MCATNGTLKRGVDILFQCDYWAIALYRKSDKNCTDLRAINQSINQYILLSRIYIQHETKQINEQHS